MNSSAIVITNTVLIVVFLLLTGFTSLLALKHRKHIAFKGRCFACDELTLVVATCYVLFTCVKQMIECEAPGVFPCALSAIPGNFFIPVLLGTFVIRSYMLNFRFEIAQRRLQRTAKDYKPSKEGDYFLERIHKTKFRYFLKVLSVFVVLHVVQTIIAAIVWNGPPACGSSGIFSICIDFIYVVALVFIGSKLRNQEHDGYGMKSELNLAAISCAILTICWLAYMNSPAGLSFEQTFPLTDLIPMTGAFLCLFVIRFIPLYKWYQWDDNYPVQLKAHHRRSPQRSHSPRHYTQQNQIKRALAKVNSLQEILPHNDRRDEFRTYLSSYFAVENLSFYEVIQDFKADFSTKSMPNLFADAQKIAMRYIVPSSEMELNLSWRCRIDICKDLQIDIATYTVPQITEIKPSECFDAENSKLVHVFDEAQAEAYRLMHEHFTRYKNMKLSESIIEGGIVVRL